MSAAPLAIAVGMIACAVGCAPKEPSALLTGGLSSNDVVQVERVIREELRLRSRYDGPGRLKSITVTTNNEYEVYRRIALDLTAEARTNRAAEVDLRKVEKRMQSMSRRPAVEVWYADKNARWGEAGYTVEKESNGWNVTVFLSR